MKTTLLLISILMPSALIEQNDSSHKLPPIEELLSNAPYTEFYELPHKTNYSVYNLKGTIVDSGYGEFINHTQYEEGTYFIKFDNKTIKLDKGSNLSQRPIENSQFYSIVFILLLVLMLFIFMYKRFKNIRNEQSNLLKKIQELRALPTYQKPEKLVSLEGSKVDKAVISKMFADKLNQSDWNIVEQLIKNPSISNKELANQVSLSVEGTRSSLKKMYRTFDIPSSRNMRLTLILKLIQSSNQPNDN